MQVLNFFCKGSFYGICSSYMVNVVAIPSVTLHFGFILMVGRFSKTVLSFCSFIILYGSYFHLAVGSQLHSPNSTTMGENLCRVFTSVHCMFRYLPPSLKSFVLHSSVI